MIRATWKGTVIADAEETVVVDGYHYFPRDAVVAEYLQESEHESVCGWKGRANYYSIVVNGATNRDAAWYYPAPKPEAAAVAGRIGFWHGVKIETGDPGPIRRRARGGWFRRNRAVNAPPATTLDGAPPRIVDLDDASFSAGTSDGWTLVDFSAQWCGPCRAFAPVFEEVASTHAGPVHFARCDVDESPLSARAVGILSIPTLVLFDPAGNEADRIVGVPSRRALDRLIARAGSHPSSAGRTGDARG